jgi:hypothetical protein
MKRTVAVCCLPGLGWMIAVPFFSSYESRAADENGRRIPVTKAPATRSVTTAPGCRTADGVRITPEAPRRCISPSRENKSKKKYFEKTLENVFSLLNYVVEVR